MFPPSPEFLVSRTSAHPSVRRPIESMAYPASLCAGREVVPLKICQHPSAASINVLIDDHIQATPSTGHSRSPSAQPSLRRPIDSMAYPASPRANRDVVHLKVCQHPSVASINVPIDDHIQRTLSTGHSRNHHDTLPDDLVDRVKSGRVAVFESCRYVTEVVACCV